MITSSMWFGSMPDRSTRARSTAAAMSSGLAETRAPLWAKWKGVRA